MSETALQLVRVLERIANALERQAAPANDETCNVEEAAELLKTTPTAIYIRHRRGQMPKPLPGSRRLIWRKIDLLR